MSLKDYLKGGSIKINFDSYSTPAGSTRDPKLHTVGVGSKGLRYGNFSDKTNGGPILGERVTFSANGNANPTFEYGDNIGKNTIDQFVRGGTKHAVEARLTDVKRLSKFVFETDQGNNFLIKETALQLLNPFKPKVYNAGVNTLASVAAAGGVNIKRGGLLPLPSDVAIGGDYLNRFEKEKDGKYQREKKFGLGNPGGKANTLSLEGLIGIDNPFAKGDSDKPYNISIDDSTLQLDNLNYYDIVANENKDEAKLKDIIPFRFEVINHKNPMNTNVIAFRAFIDSIGDDYTANHNEIKYNGRAEKFYTYNSFDRKISLGFKIAAQTRHEMRPLYQKLNYLISQTAPGYAGGRIKTPFMRLTVGDWFNRVPGVLTSVNLGWEKDYVWEIAADDGDDGQDLDMLILPHVLDVSINFTPIHDFLPSAEIFQSYFIANGFHSPAPPPPPPEENTDGEDATTNPQVDETNDAKVATGEDE